jgi:hypothetical protein
MLNDSYFTYSMLFLKNKVDQNCDEIQTSVCYTGKSGMRSAFIVLLHDFNVSYAKYVLNLIPGKLHVLPMIS